MPESSSMPESSPVPAPGPKPPAARRAPVVRERHGERLEDPYAWLRDPNWQQVMKAPEALRADVRAHLEAENAHTEAVLAPLAGLREALFAEMRARIKEDDASVPEPDGPFAYYERFREGGQHPVFCRRRSGREDAPEAVLLDGDAEAEGKPYFDVHECVHAPDHRLLAYSEDLNGSEYYTIRFRDLDTGEPLPDEIPETQGGITWANDARTVFYTRLDAHHRPSKVYRHVLGTPVADDALVYEEPDPGFFVGVDQTESRRWIVIDAHDHETSEVRLVDADDPGAAPRLVAARERALEYSVTHHPHVAGGDRLLILTNADGAEDFKVVHAPVGAPGRTRWRDLVPHRPGVLVLALEVYAGHLVRLEREDGLPRIVVRRLADGAEHAIEFDEEAYSLGLHGSYEFDTTRLRFGYSSLATPERVYDYDMETRERTLRKEQEVPSGHDPADYVARRLFAVARDGERVPVSLLRHRDTPVDGSAPCLLYGYGAYGISMPASFATNRFSLVDRGFVYAIAHVRGGKERGYRWYREGRREAKQNTFHDFIAAAEHLVETGHAARAGLACMGGSAGGLLIGAVLNLRPDLWRAAVAQVPFVDVLSTMSDDTLPLTPPEWPEWGNPVADREAYRLMRSYSPYDNVEAKAYPSLLVTAGLTDPRVTYWEPAKWVARLRERKTDDNPLLLKTIMEAGHGGPAGRFDYLEEVAMVYAFLLWGMGKA